MKKALVIMMALALLLSCAACTPAQQSQTETETATQPETEVTTESTAPESAASTTEAATDNPLAGKAVDEDGNPYVLAYVVNETGSGWMTANLNYVKSLWERAGGEFHSYVSDYDLNKEASMIDDAMQVGADAIVVHPSDSHAIAPAVQKALTAGYPVFAIDQEVIGADVNCFASTNQADMGTACGQYVTEHFSADNPAKILVIAGGLQQIAAQQRQAGFESAIADCAYASIVQTIDTGWSSDVAYSGIQDAFEANPDINVIYSHSDFMMQGVIEGLRAKDKLVAAGQDGHVMVVSIDADPLGLQNIRDGYVDMCAENNPVTPSAIMVNVILSQLYGQKYDSVYTLEVPVVTKDNVDSNERWANLPSGEYDSWPIPQAALDVFPIPSR